MGGKNIWIIIPAYNEDKVITEILSQLKETYPAYKILLVDDGSNDNTLHLAEKFNIYLLKHLINLGQGAALATGIEFALRNNAEYVFTYDADGQMCPTDLKEMLTCIEKQNVDVVLGSRFLTKKPESMPYLKYLLLKLAIIFTRTSTKLAVTDTHNGLRLFKSNALRKVELTQNRMAHSSQILEEISRLKLTYQEVPVTIRYTDYSIAKGQSLFNLIRILYELFVGGVK